MADLVKNKGFGRQATIGAGTGGGQAAQAGERAAEIAHNGTGIQIGKIRKPEEQWQQRCPALPGSLQEDQEPAGEIRAQARRAEGPQGEKARNDGCPRQGGPARHRPLHLLRQRPGEGGDGIRCAPGLRPAAYRHRGYGAQAAAQDLWRLRKVEQGGPSRRV